MRGDEVGEAVARRSGWWGGARGLGVAHSTSKKSEEKQKMVHVIMGRVIFQK